jgi:hypothetical protein
LSVTNRATASLSRILEIVVTGLPDVSERSPDELAAVDHAVLGQDELALTGVAETLEPSAAA